eukprot:CAMPEP_0206633444 /NCGR_PEP_ID=MMETSP0325_2-20121206/69492_1 /ASSEMBLY_ACC=CAM_ASM_000347 /TAXON_ID=2866 /ORGANISM="Crypthecodinium cohnii, Strain Seligo" /LENGTH=80 /DNA_ID=CAMNT_0054159135 /DNA_START=176 /DNA_END=415 /DNA_ORIENTATION=+
MSKPRGSSPRDFWRCPISMPESVDWEVELNRRGEARLPRQTLVGQVPARDQGATPTATLEAADTATRSNQAAIAGPLRKI